MEPKLATNLFRGNRNARRNGHIWQTSLSFPVRDCASLRKESTSEEGMAKGIGGGGKLFVGETPGEGLGVEADTKDGAHDESFLKVRAWSRKANTDRVT